MQEEAPPAGHSCLQPTGCTRALNKTHLTVQYSHGDIKTYFKYLHCKCTFACLYVLLFTFEVEVYNWTNGRSFFFPYPGQHRRGALQPQSSQLLQNPRRPVSRKAIMWQRWGDSQGFQSRIVNLERTTSGEAGSGGDSGGLKATLPALLHKKHSGEELAGASVHSETETLLVGKQALGEEHAWKNPHIVPLKAEDNANYHNAPLCNHNHPYIFICVGSLVTYGGCMLRRPTRGPVPLSVI